MQALAGPAGGNLDVALVPGDAEEVAHRLRQVRHLYVPGDGVLLVLRQEVPAHVARQGGDELGLGGDLVAEALGLQDTRQADLRVGGKLAAIPLGVDTLVLAVESETPFPGERGRAGPRGLGRHRFRIEGQRRAGSSGHGDERAAV